jgi:hypothetical protein
MDDLTLEELKELVKDWEIPLETKVKQYIYKHEKREAAVEEILKHFEPDNPHMEILKVLMCEVEMGSLDMFEKNEKTYYKPSTRWADGLEFIRAD